MSSTTPSSIDLAALIVSLGVLIVASLSDLKTREVSNRFWIIYAPIAAVLFIGRIVFAPDTAAILLVSAAATIVVAFLLFQFGAMGGADSKALMCIALALPVAPAFLSPLWQAPLIFYPFPIAILVNSFLLSISMMFILLGKNILSRSSARKGLFQGFEKESILRKAVALLQSRGGFIMTSSILNPAVNDNDRSLGVKVLAADEFSVQSLMKLGLTEYEARIYVVLTKMGPRNASEISFLGKVPRPKTYGAIRGLESKGLLRIVPGNPERYMAVSPNDVLVPLVDKLNKETTECVQVVENLAMAFESSRYVYTEKPYERYDLWSVRGRDKVYKRVQDMIGEAKVNVFFTTTANGLVRIYKAHSEVLEKASERGAKVRVAAPINQINQSVARELGEVIEVRNVTVPMMHFASADSAEIIFVEDLPDDTNVNAGQDVATWTNDPLLVKSHEKIFDQIWSTLQQKEVVKAKAR